MALLTSEREKARQAARRKSHRRHGQAAVRRRWQQANNRCEGCGLVVPRVQVAHLFSSAGHIISDDWASRGELMAPLCCAETWGNRIGCHELVDRNLDPDLRDTLRWLAIIRLCEAEGVVMHFGEDAEPLGAIRRLVDALSAVA